MSALSDRVARFLPTSLSRAETWLIGFVASLIYIRSLEPVGLLVVVLEGVPVQTIPMLVGAAGVLGGPVAVVGTVAGYVGYQSFQGTAAVWTSVEYLSLGLLVHLFWSRAEATDIRSPLQSITQVRVFLTVFTLAAFGSASLSAWGYAATGQYRFFPLVVFSGVSQAFSALLGGVIVLGLVPRLLGNPRWQSAVGIARSRPRHARSRAWIRLSLGICCGWLVVGSAVSVGYRTVALLPAEQFRLRGLDALLLFAETGPFNDTVSGLQVGIGVTAISLWVLSVYRYDIVGSHRATS